MKHIKQILALLITLGLLASLVIPTVSAADTGVAPAEPVETVAAEESPPEESTEPEAATEPSGETEETGQSEEPSEAPVEPNEPPETEATEATEATAEVLEDEPQAEPTEEEKSLSYENNAEPQAAGTSIVHGKGITTVGTLTISYYNTFLKMTAAAKRNRSRKHTDARLPVKHYAVGPQHLFTGNTRRVFRREGPLGIHRSDLRWVCRECFPDADAVRILVRKFPAEIAVTKLFVDSDRLGTPQRRCPSRKIAADVVLLGRAQACNAHARKGNLKKIRSERHMVSLTHKRNVIPISDVEPALVPVLLDSRVKFYISDSAAANLRIYMQNRAQRLVFGRQDRAKPVLLRAVGHYILFHLHFYPLQGFDRDHYSTVCGFFLPL